MPPIIPDVDGPNLFLFGQIGVGKSYLGQRLAGDYGFTFCEGDHDITPAMRTAIAARTPFTPAMRREFADLLAHRIATLATGTPGFCIAQAFFKNSERHHVRAEFPDLTFVWVRADPHVIAERLRQRTKHVADLAYAEFANPHFAPPDFPHRVIENDGDEQSLRRQIAELLNP